MRSPTFAGPLMRRAASCVPLLIVLMLATLTWAPALFAGRTLVHGDYVVMSLVEMKIQAEALAGHEAFIWTRQFYGGHPFFAESQGGFVNPVNVFFGAFVTPYVGVVYAAGLLHWLCVVLGGVGMVGLCRCLGMSRSAQIVASVAAVFSSLWVFSEPNLTVAAVLATLPWIFWAFECWIEAPGVKSGLALGAATAWCFVAGYPHALYAAVIFMGARLVVEALFPSTRAALLRQWPAYLLSGAAAVVFFFGAAAVQIAPMLELVPQSYRTRGVGLLPMFFSRAVLEHAIRGALFQEDPLLTAVFPLVGSVAVCILAALAPLVTRSPRVIGLFVATALLLNLGMAASPIFKIIYFHNLLPGLHLFRIMYPFHFVAVVGVGLLAGFASDALQRPLPRMRDAWWRLGVAALVLAGFAWLVLRYYQRPVPVGAIVAVCVAASLFVGLTLAKRRRWAPAMLAVVVAASALVERTHPYPFFPSTIIHEPPIASLIKASPHWQDFKHTHITLSEGYGLMPAGADHVDGAFSRARDAMIAATNELWGINSTHGSFALRLARRQILDDVLNAELTGHDPTPAGLRMIDILGIKFVSLDTPTSAAALTAIWHGDSGVWAFENHAARPRFQFYGDATAVRSPQQALDILDNLSVLRLVIETPDGAAPRLPAAESNTSGAAPAAHYDLREDRSTRYRLHTSSKSPAWLFLADADYPGWRASVDGVSAPLYPAQVLGKAVHLPAGDHDVVIEYLPMSFYVGAAISAITLLLTAVIVAVLWIRRRPRALSTC